SPILVDDKLFCGSKDGTMLAFSADESLEFLGSSKLDSPVNATPAVANNRLFIRTDTHLICIEGR
ncbi:MAG: pyrrolo-quinoline quinone, partial [Verrucomicrobiota bacterium]